jgi:hypothetical protein
MASIPDKHPLTHATLPFGAGDVGADMARGFLLRSDAPVPSI